MKKLLLRGLAFSIIIYTSFTVLFGVETKSKSTEPTAVTLAKEIQQNPNLFPQSQSIPARHRARKDWNFLVYFAANNNLHEFAMQNIRQMMQVGSTNNVNVIIQLDELGARKVTRFYIQRGSLSAVFHDSNNASCISGTKDSLYNFLKWSLKTYPANHNCLVLWNHGSGIKDPSIWGRPFLVHRKNLFSINKETGLYELNRKLSHQYASHERGIAFNETFEEYLTNQDLQEVLTRASQQLLGGKKFEILCMDACMMAMAEVASQVKTSVSHIVASEEVEPGSGYDYSLVLAPFDRYTMSPDNFAKHIVYAYGQQYYKNYADYTQSAINVSLTSALEENFAQITQILTEFVTSANGPTCAKLIRDIRLNSAKTLEFDDSDYVDMGTFYASLYRSLDNVKAFGKRSAVSTLKEKVARGIAILQKMVIANVAGSNLNRATGLSFYFPTRAIHSSYPKTVFDQTTKWSGLLAQLLKSRHSTLQPVTWNKQLKSKFKLRNK